MTSRIPFLVPLATVLVLTACGGDEPGRSPPVEAAEPEPAVASGAEAASESPEASDGNDVALELSDVEQVKARLRTYEARLVALAEQAAELEPEEQVRARELVDDLAARQEELMLLIFGRTETERSAPAFEQHVRERYAALEDAFTTAATTIEGLSGAGGAAGPSGAYGSTSEGLQGASDGSVKARPSLEQDGEIH